MNIRPVILSGGSGTRLWPLSRQRLPKQFAPILDGEPFFTTTLRRVSDRSLYLAPIIVGHREHQFVIQDTLRQLGIEDATLLLEPQARNTGAAALCAALYDLATPCLHLLLPSDHIVKDEERFHGYVADAARYADTRFVLFGIAPTRPETAYGYIQRENELPGSPLQRVVNFHEKPDTATAELLIALGALWNSGMFLYNPRLLCRETEALAPTHYSHCLAAMHDSAAGKSGITLSARHYASLRPHSLDTLIMEHTDNASVMECSFGWSDVGNWPAVSEHSPRDEQENTLFGPVVAQNIESCYIRTQGPTVAAVGLKDCMVIAQNDCVLVMAKDQAHDMKSLLVKLEQECPALMQSSTKVLKPWGMYENLAFTPYFKIKHITVNAGQSLSLQTHKHRNEHWIVIAGIATVAHGERQKKLHPNETLFISQGDEHRLTNRQDTPLQLVEIQTGSLFDEEDVIRIEDQYGRETDA